MDCKIDFVQTWVDGTDPQWLKLRRKYEAREPGISLGDANGDCRYKDNGLLKYFFRAVEKFAPWVNKVFFVTCGQKPPWLNVNCPRLRFVNHADYMPADWLPTFHSNAIELNLHRIKDLSEHFVLFNDDLFLLRAVKPEDFFRSGLPVIPCDLALPPWIGGSNIGHIMLNNSGLVKNALDVQREIWRSWRKNFSVGSLGFVRAAKNLASIAVNRTVIYGCFGHLAHAHLKSTLEELWERFPAVLERTSRHKFRADDSVNQWLASAWDLTRGRFFPANEKRIGRHMTINPGSVGDICAFISRARCSQLCLDEKGGTQDLERCFAEVGKALETLLPEKSSFEL